MLFQWRKSFLCLLLLGAFGLCCSSLFFPTNTAYGIFAAISVPLDLPRNVFVSYNFEANYNMPATWYLPEYWHGRSLQEYYAPRKLESVNVTPELTTTASAEEPLRRSLLSRMDFYRILNDKFRRAGLNGEACLLRLICEINNESAELANVNGLLGSVMRVIFSPSSSAKDAELPASYMEAEIHGVLDQCAHYEKNCSASILDLISSTEADILIDVKENM